MIGNILHISFILQKEHIFLFRYFHFSQSYSGSSFQPDIIGFKESPTFNSNNNFDDGYCNTKYLKLAGILASQNLYVTILVSLFYILLIILTVYFRDDQPLKSRGLGPTIVPLFFAIDLWGDHINSIQIGYEQNYYFDCYLSVFVLYPCSMIS